MSIRFTFILLFTSALVAGQSAHGHLIDADKKFKSGDFQAAEFAYRKAKEKEDNFTANFNLGNATQLQGNFEQSISYYENATRLAKSDNESAMAYFNLGNAHLQMDKPDDALAAYKTALKLDRGNEDIRTNILMAQLMKDMQEAQPQQQDKENQENQEQQENQEEQDQQEQQQQEQESQEQQEQENKEGEEQEQDSSQQQSAAPTEFDSTRLEKQTLDSMDAIKLLQIIQSEEQKVQEKLRKYNSNRKRPDKDW